MITHDLFRQGPQKQIAALLATHRPYFEISTFPKYKIKKLNIFKSPIEFYVGPARSLVGQTFLNAR